MSSTHTEFMQSKPSKSLKAVRVEISKGAVTASQSHQTETIIIVLEGVWRFRLAERMATLKKDDVLHIPAQECYSSEALDDTVALKVATAPHHAGQQFALPHEDPDQYLWGV